MKGTVLIDLLNKFTSVQFECPLGWGLVTFRQAVPVLRCCCEALGESCTELLDFTDQ